MRCFVGIIVTGYTAAAVAALSLGLRVLFDSDGNVLGNWPRRALAMASLFWLAPSTAAVMCQLGHFVFVNMRGLWRRVQQRHGRSEEDEVPLTNGGAFCSTVAV